MLDMDTRRRIDTARDILVGKVPDPKSQVEQITIALIYKFMDDIDGQSEELGGKRTFFAGDFARYGWPKLVRSGLGGFEMLNLYAEAITRMPENPGIPPLFRSIFSNAYLPYREPETLRAFLRIIDEFTYDHSERLGDAFEYLLSVLGSQGDAGQFRTPRHIIDFIVAVVDPKNDETVLDPACGTAGFLISSYNHIKNANADDRGNDTLTPEERRRLADNFRGYDISPDMVRLSLANMYLHSFADPHIYEYDTLTSDDRWNDYADVILANPPFMSPKGGIRPHNRFSVQSRRSEVLFVDYIAEHLTTTGRAGIIVPEGVIFQRQRAHTQLRKTLVEQYLVAVVSLPSGVFNPYSGVKTSILILDRTLARRADRIAFFKVDNDGYDLGAQRRPVDRDDLPVVRAELGEYLRRLRVGESCDDFAPQMGLVVAKDRIVADGDYILSGERYALRHHQLSEYPMTPLSQLCELARGVTYTKGDEVETGGHKVLRANNIDRSTSALDLTDIKRLSTSVNLSENKKLRANDIFICMASGSKEHMGKVSFIPEDTDYYFGGFMGAVRSKLGRVEPRFLFCQLRYQKFNEFLRNRIAGANINNLNAKILYEFQIPLPPLEVQRELVAEIEGYQRVLDGARAVVDNWRPRVDLDPEWPVVALHEACDIQRGKFSHRPRNEPRFYGGHYPFIQTGDVTRSNGGKIQYTQTLNNEGLAVSRLFQPPVVVITIAANIGDTAVLDFPCCFPDSVVGLSPNAETDPWFLELMMRTKKEYLTRIAPQAAQKNINVEILKNLEVPLPPLETQRAIVAEIEAERALVSVNRELVKRMEGRIAAAIGRVWVDQG